MRKRKLCLGRWRETKISHEVSEVAGAVSMTRGLSKAHLRGEKGLKLQVETKWILNTGKYLL